jgi:hypothetical protein
VRFSANVTESVRVRVKASAARASDSLKVMLSVVVRVLPAAAVLDSEKVRESVEVFATASVRATLSLKLIESVGSGREKLCAVRSADSANVMLSSAVTTNDAGAAVSNPRCPARTGGPAAPARAGTTACLSP